MATTCDWWQFGHVPEQLGRRAVKRQAVQKAFVSEVGQLKDVLQSI